MQFTSSDLNELRMKEAQCRFAGLPFAGLPVCVTYRNSPPARWDAHGVPVRSMFNGSGFAGTLAALQAGIWRGYGRSQQAR